MVTSSKASEAYAVQSDLKSDRLHWAGVTKTGKIRDAFSEKCKRQFHNYWTAREDAFTKDWSGESLRINAPFSKMRDVVQKVIMDQARGIMIVPVWERQSWFWALGEMAPDWWDLPSDIPIYQDNAGNTYPQRSWATRVVLINGLDTDSNPIDKDRKSSLGAHRSNWADGHDPRCSRVVMQALNAAAQDRREGRNIRSVFEGDLQHPDAAKFRETLQKEFQDVLTFPDKPLSNIEARSLRGEAGVHTIQLIPNAITKYHPPCRSSGLRGV